MDINVLANRQLDINQHREMLVQNLGIFELRALGRELGVSSPTTKKRDELIELILDKIYNSDSTVIRQTKKGRPFKKLYNLDDIMSQMTRSDETDSLNNQKRPLKYEDIICFAQEVPVFSDVDDEVEKFSGVVRTSSAVSYFLDVKTGKKIFINSNEMKKYNFQEGDFVEAEARKINPNNQYLLSSAQTINFTDAKRYDASRVETGNPIISLEKIEYGDFRLYCGRRNLILTKNNLFEDDRFVNFAKFCNDNDYNLITLGLNTSFEDQILFSQISSMVNMTTAYGSGYDEGFNKVVDSIALTQRLLSEGKKVVLFVSDIISLINTLDQCFEECELQNGHNAKGIVIAQKLISLGKALNNGSSVTIVMTYRENDRNDMFITNELERICSKFQD